MYMPEISIVLPTYNGALYIREAIDSVITQTFSNWELIIVDDCSTDATPDIAEEYTRLDKRIRCIHNANNLKLPAALNVGFSKAQGRYLTWTSDDNKYFPEALEKMWGYMEKNIEYPMVCAGMQVHFEGTNEMQISSGYNAEKMMCGNCVGACFLYRKSVRNKIGDYNTDYFCVEDYEYWLRVLRKCGEIARIDEVLYWYRHHANSLSMTKQRLIRDQLDRLYSEYLPWMVERLTGNTTALVALYGEMVGQRKLPLSNIKKLFLPKIPLIEKDEPFSDYRKVFLFGAGYWGKWAKDFLRGKDLLFVDNDIRKVGTLIEGVPVISFSNFVDEYKNTEKIQVIICSDYRYQYEMMEQLSKNGINIFTIYQHLKRQENDLQNRIIG
jgi:glycosyltransferase involved in cell wall biosynthesis